MAYKIDYIKSNNFQFQNFFAQGKKFDCKYLRYLNYFKLSDKHAINETYVIIFI